MKRSVDKRRLASGIRKDYTNAARLGQKKSKSKAAAAAASAPAPTPTAEPAKPVSAVREIKDKVTEIKGQRELTEVLKSAKNNATILECYATWCGPCHQVSPIFERCAAQYKKVVALKMNVDVAQDLTDEFAISAIPAFLVFKNEVLVEKLLGKEKIEALFSKYNA